MAVLALGLVGASVGSAIGGTLLGMSAASIGWTVGSALGSILFAPDAPDTQGPRLNDLRVQSSTRGAPIPKVYGTSRIAGNVIWSAGIKETSHTQSVGGKGGGGSTHTSYTYSCSFAVGLCEGEITGIRRIWADSVLIYNKGDEATADELAVSDQIGISIYTGSETQYPDPVIEADKGVGNVPAYRGLAYVVFENLQLEKYGNRIPNITCEIVEVGTITSKIVNFFDTPYNNGGFHYPVHYDSNSGRIRHVGQLGSVDGYDYATWTTDVDGGDISSVIETVDNKSTTVVVRHANNSEFPDIYWAAYGGLPPFTYLHEDNLGNKYGRDGITVGTSSLYEWDSNTRQDAIVVGSNLYVLLDYRDDRNDITPEIYRWCLLIKKYDLDTPGVEKHSNLITLIRHNDSTNTLNFSYDEASGHLFVFTTGGGTDLEDGFREIDLDGNLLNYWAVPTYIPGSDTVSDEYPTNLPEYNSFPIVHDRLVYRSIARVSKGYSVFVHKLHDNGDYTLEDYAESLPDEPGESYKNTKLILLSPSKLMSSRYTVIIGGVQYSEVSLENVLAGLLSEAGVDSSNLYFSLTDTLKGFVRSQRMTTASAIASLIDSYNITAVESDFKLKFSSRSGVPSGIIDNSELAAHESGTAPDPLKTTRTDDTQLPRKITVNYTDFDGDYQPGVQQAQRVKVDG